LGIDPWIPSPDPVIFSNGIIPDKSGHAFTTSFANFVRRRSRLEQGNPYKVISMRSPLDHEDGHGHDADDFSYSNGICAWIGEDGFNTYVITLNILTGRIKKFTTANREVLLQVRVSESLVAALSIRGNCHVWNYDTPEPSSFRVPSLDCNHILIHKTRIVLDYGDYLVHWSWDTRIARTIDIGETAVALAVHPLEDRITLVHFCREDEKRCSEPEMYVDSCGEEGPLIEALPTYQLQTTTYALNSKNEWFTCFSRCESIPRSFFPEYWILGNIGARRDAINPGQSSVIERIETDRGDRDRKHGILVYVSVEPNGQVAIHTMPRELASEGQFVCPERGILYASFVEGDEQEHRQWTILKARIMPSTSNSYTWYDYSIQRMEKREQPLRILGDAQFMVFLGQSTLDIWAMDENGAERDDDGKMSGLDRTHGHDTCQH
jgi:hypothetical protein